MRFRSLGIALVASFLLTLTVQAYNPALGVTVPDSVRAVGAEAGFRRLIERTAEVHGTLSGKVGPAADYILTNAHRRRVLLKLNVRELYHLSRLRQDDEGRAESPLLRATEIASRRETGDGVE